MEFQFKAVVVLTVEHNAETENAYHRRTEFNLVIDDDLNKEGYFTEEGLANESGSEVLSNILVQGLIGNIHLAHQQGFRDSAAHLRWIIAELEQGFITNYDISKSHFRSQKK
jgi:hypothetical protein